LTRVNSTLRIALLALLVMSIALLSAPAAHAIAFNHFCPTSGTRALEAYGHSGDRCTTHYFSMYRVIAYNDNGYDTCAAFKAESGGGGPDQYVRADCEYGAAVVETTVADPISDWATIINKQGAAHTGFHGTTYYTG
jgi:hypothetical protein